MKKLTQEEIKTLKKAEKILRDATSTEVLHTDIHTVTNLCVDSLKAVIEGNGDKKVFVAGDDEGYHYHSLGYLLDTNPKKNTLDSIRDYSDMGDLPDEEICLLG